MEMPKPSREPILPGDIVSCPECGKELLRCIKTPEIGSTNYHECFTDIGWGGKVGTHTICPDDDTGLVRHGRRLHGPRERQRVDYGESGITAFQPHSDKQDEAIFSEAMINAICTGIQWGKTETGAVRMKMKNHHFIDPTDNFIIFAPTYKILQQSSLPAYLRLMRGYGDYSKSDSVFKVNGGGNVYCRTATDPDSIVGITNVRHIWVDEAGLISLYAWENVQARAAFKQATIDLTTSPYTLNWLFKEIIRPKQKNPLALPHVKLIQAASWENPYMPKGMIEQARLTMDPRRFNALFGGMWERMTGLVYDCFDETENQCDEFTLPPGTRYVGGIDWGYTDPFVFKIRGILPTGEHFGIHEVYKTGLTPSDLAEVVLRLVRIYNVSLIYADPSQPGAIEDLNRMFAKEKVKCAVVPADNDIKVGIGRHYEMLKTRRLKYFKGLNQHTIDEIDTYHYPSPEDLGPDQNSKDAKPVAQADHACFAAGTLVQTTRGPIPIERIEAGMRVVTPLGDQFVLRSGMTGMARTVYAEFSNGVRNEGTANHPYYLRGKGFKSLDGQVSDTVQAWNSTDKNIAGTVVTGVLVAAARMAASVSTWPSGNPITVLCRKAGMSIMWTMTAVTTTSQTLWRCRRASTSSIMPMSGLMSDGLSNEPWRSEFVPSRSHGIGALRAGRGIVSMLRHQYRESRDESLATSAAQSSTRRDLTPRFARIIVSRLLDAKAAWTTFMSRVSSATRPSARTSTPVSEPVRLVALRPSLLAPKPVYNLKVEGGCFYANGILVSNCDAERYISMMTANSGQTRAPFVPQQVPKQIDHHKETEMLKRRKPGGGQTENW